MAYLGELLFAAVRKTRVDLLDRILLLAKIVPVLPVHEAAAQRYAELRAELERHLSVENWIESR